jgi:uncharacterized NAD-dependent epimerase/dehydratase family protein
MDGTALVFCEGAFGTPRGRTANTLARHSERYDVVGVVDSRFAGLTAADVVDGASAAIPVFADLEQATARLGVRPDYFVVGLDPDDGRLEPRYRRVVAQALRLGMHVDSALEPYLHDDAEFPGLAMQHGARLRSVGRTSSGGYRAYTGRAGSLDALKVAVVGTNPVGGKVITAVRVARALRAAGVGAEVVGTSTLAWFQGIAHTTLLDGVPQRHVGGELEGAMLSAYERTRSAILLLEGRGGLLDPTRPCDLELLTTAQPDAVILQHAPTHESIPAGDQYGLGVVKRHLGVVEAVTGRPVLAVTLSHSGRDQGACHAATALFRGVLDCPVMDIFVDGPEPIAAMLVELRAGAAPALAHARRPLGPAPVTQIST